MMKITSAQKQLYRFGLLYFHCPSWWLYYVCNSLLATLTQWGVKYITLVSQSLCPSEHSENKMTVKLTRSTVDRYFTHPTKLRLTSSTSHTGIFNVCTVVDSQAIMRTGKQSCLSSTTLDIVQPDLTSTISEASG